MTRKLQVAVYIGKFVGAGMPERGIFHFRAFLSAKAPNVVIKTKCLTFSSSTNKLYPPETDGKVYYSAGLVTQPNTTFFVNDSFLFELDFPLQNKSYFPETHFSENKSLQKVTLNFDLVQFDIINSSLKGVEIFKVLKSTSIPVRLDLEKNIFTPLAFEASHVFCVVDIIVWTSKTTISNNVANLLNNSREIVVKTYVGGLREKWHNNEKNQHSLNTAFRRKTIHFDLRHKFFKDENFNSIKSPTQNILTENLFFSEHFFPKKSAPSDPALLSKPVISALKTINDNTDHPHLVVFCHGYKGSSFDMENLRNQLVFALYTNDAEKHFFFLLSKANEKNSDAKINEMGKNLSIEILEHIAKNWGHGCFNGKISFVTFSLGALTAQSCVAQTPELWPKLHSFWSLGGCNLGYFKHESAFVSSVFWLMRKLKRSECLSQLCMEDETDIKKTFLFKLGLKGVLKHFKTVILVSSPDDTYIPFDSSRIEFNPDNNCNCCEIAKIAENMIKPLEETDIIKVNVRFNTNGNNCGGFFAGQNAHMAFVSSRSFALKLFLVYVDRFWKE